jgi:hypothetical protein
VRLCFGEGNGGAAHQEALPNIEKRFSIDPSCSDLEGRGEESNTWRTATVLLEKLVSIRR